MNSSEARQGKKYKVDRLVLKAMTDEAPKARYQAAKPQDIANALRTTRSAFASAKISTLNASRLRSPACETGQSKATQSRN
jgi:hypothetical protein